MFCLKIRISFNYIYIYIYIYLCVCRWVGDCVCVSLSVCEYASISLFICLGVFICIFDFSYIGWRKSGFLRNTLNIQSNLEGFLIFNSGPHHSLYMTRIQIHM